MPRDDDRFSDRPPPDDRGDKWERDEDWERGARTPRDDYDRPYPDDIRLRRSQMSWIDRQFLDTHLVILLILCLCCNVILFPLSLVGVCVCKVPEARQKATVCVILSGILFVLGVLSRTAQMAHLMR
jgi:hypothetical protein